MFRLYARVLGLLGPQMRLGWLLALANVALAAAALAEPVLFGRIIDALAGAQGAGGALDWPRLTPLVAAWVGFGLFLIVCGALVSLYADKLAHKRRQAVLSDYFEHVLQLPLSFHSATHSGRLMKVMLTGTDTLWWLWLGFFREHLAAIVSIAVLLPLALYLNWRLGLLLIGLSLIFLALTVFVLRKTEAMQKSVERYYSDLAERASDTLGNVALVQSFTRVEDEVRELRAVVERLLGAQMPVLSWWALVSTLTKASTTLTMLAILILGLYLFARGQTTIGGIVMFMSFAGMLIQRLEQAARFVNSVFMNVPRLEEFFGVLDTTISVKDRKNAVTLKKVRGEVAFDGVTFSYDGKAPAVEDLTFKAEPGETIALVGATGAGKSTAMALLYRVYDPQSGKIGIDGRDIRDVKLTSLRRNIGVIFQEPLLFNRSIAENLRVGNPDATDDGDPCRLQARRGARLHRAPRGRTELNGRRARPHALRRRAPAAVDRASAVEGPADPDPRRGDERARCRHRGKGDRRAQRGDEGPHHLRHRPSARHGQERNAHPRVRSRPHRRERQLRCAGGEARRVRQTGRSPVPRAGAKLSVMPAKAGIQSLPPKPASPRVTSLPVIRGPYAL